MPSGRDYARGDQVERGAPGDDHRPPGRGAQGDGRPEHGAEAARDGADAVPAGGRNVQGEGPVREALEHCAHLQHKGMPSLLLLVFLLPQQFRETADYEYSIPFDPKNPKNPKYVGSNRI